jgi:hypothetical protein
VFITALRSGRCNTDSASLRLTGRGAGFSGLVFAPGSDGSQICLASVGGFRTGIELHSDGNRIQGSTIGMELDGETADPNEDDGILVTGDRNVIGGDFLPFRNVISGNEGAGVHIAGGSGNRVAGNAIGVDRLTVLSFPNGGGVFVDDEAVDTIVGGTEPGERNVISGNAGIGIEAGAGKVVGNLIGLNSLGDAVPNGDMGVHAVGPLQLGGGEDAERNVISGHDVDVQLDGRATVEGNWIGPDVNGRALDDPTPLTGREVGIRLRAGGTGATIRDNVVAGQEIGIESVGLSNGFAVEDNLVGLAPDGTTEISTLAGIRVGRESDDARIAGNTVLGGILGLDLLGDETRVEGNTVGLNGAGAAPGELPDPEERGR